MKILLINFIYSENVAEFSIFSSSKLFACLIIKYFTKISNSNFVQKFYLVFPVFRESHFEYFHIIMKIIAINNSENFAWYKLISFQTDRPKDDQDVFSSPSYGFHWSIQFDQSQNEMWIANENRPYSFCILMLAVKKLKIAFLFDIVSPILLSPCYLHHLNIH